MSCVHLGAQQRESPKGNMSLSDRYGRTDDELAAIQPALREGYFSGKVVLISGAGSGIGRALAHWAARLGAEVVLCGRDAEKLKDAAAAIGRYGARTMVHALTIRDPRAVAVLFDTAWGQFGRVDVLINNAGGQFPSPAMDISPKGWQAVVDTNLNGTWYMMQAAAQCWRQAGLPGSIVNIVAVIGRGMPGIAHTCAARAGVIHLAKTLAIEWAPLNIRVNCVAPGIIATNGMNVYPAEVLEVMPQTNLMKRFGEVEDIANAVCLLAGDGGGFVTGEVLHVDGGNHIWGDQWTIPKPDYFKVDK
jgi:citronellol/citronellal dehydrogenase